MHLELNAQTFIAAAPSSVRLTDFSPWGQLSMIPKRVLFVPKGEKAARKISRMATLGGVTNST